jgi:hypothetical protein
MSQSGERYPWYEPAFYEQLAQDAERIQNEEGSEVARAFVYFALELHQLSFALTPLWAAPVRGSARDPDWWTSLRPGVEACAAAIEASSAALALGYAEHVDRNRRIVARVVELIAERGAGASDQVRKQVAGQCDRLLRRAPSCPVRKPRRNSPPWGERSKELGHRPMSGQRDLFLQHPRDEPLRRARAASHDDVLAGLLDAWVDDLAENYQQLVSGVGQDAVQHADVVFDAVATGDGDMVLGLSSPASMRVENSLKGETPRRVPVATDQLVLPSGLSPQPDGIHASTGERWRICGHRLSDGSVMPCTGSYRIALRNARQRPVAP